MRIHALCLAALCVALAPCAVHAQDLSDRNFRVGGNLALGVAGELDSQVNDTRGDTDLDPSVGFDLRGELPVLDFLVVGGFFEFLSVQTDTSGSEREETFSFDGYLRARWVFEVVDRTLWLEPYVLLPIGFSMAVLPDGPDGGTADDIWPGWNTGVFAGAQVIHQSGFGGYLELGWRHAEVYMDQTVLGFDLHTSLILNEMALNFGALYVFGG
jgi:hypothetical protein